MSIAWLKKLMKFPARCVNDCYNLVQLKRFHVTYDHTLKLNGRLYISGNGISLEKGVEINSGYRFNPIGGDTRTILVTRGQGKIAIGENTGISNSAIVAYRSVKIGKNVLIGGSCKIYDTDFHSLDEKIRITQPLEDITAKPVVIEDGVFIGAHAIILKGVTIGKGSIVGAGSVVTKSIPPGEIWAGNPARFIRKTQ